MAAVVVATRDLGPLRDDLDALVPDGWCHTSEKLRTENGPEETLQLLSTLDASYDACVIVDHVNVNGTDDLEQAMRVRGGVMRRLLLALHEGEGSMHESAQLAVVEEHRIRRVNNFDRSTRQRMIVDGLLPNTMGMVHASPGSEHLLWLPDAVCSAYRREKLGIDSSLFDGIREFTSVRKLR